MTRTEIMVSEFCNQLAVVHRGVRNMHSWYVFSDKRSGSVQERFELDARKYFEYEKMFQGAK